MNILIISNGYPPQRWAGNETYTAGIAEELTKRNHRVQVLCVGEWEGGSRYWKGIQEDSVNGVSVYRINLNWSKAPDPFRYLYNNPVVAEYLTGYLQEQQPDVVHVTSCENLSASVLQVVKEAGIPLILSLTDFWFLCPRMSLLRSDGENCDGNTMPWECLQCEMLYTKAYRWSQQFLGENVTSRALTQVSKYPIFTRQRGLRGYAGDFEKRKSFLHEALELPDTRITASQFVRDVYLSNGVNSEIEVTPYGHDLTWLESYEGKSLSKVIRIGFIGQILYSKGVHVLLEAAQRIQNNLGEKFSFSIYGILYYRPDYGNSLYKLGESINNLEFCGTYSHDESATVFEGIDVLVVPSLWYDFPLIIHEAFATRTPVIATNLGGMAESVTHNINGLLFERGDVDDLSNQLSRIVNEPGLLERLQEGIPSVKSIDEEVDELESLYRKLIKQAL